ncbi:ABC transporter family substrate-binding protein [Streptomyces caniscabiei]|uniref:ABC transporter family substrate-binding protein n=1 Tax=Streptomyces caniscabiei TaxID=2746961 RepID=A0ABU4N7B0_9ACTN|nr:ABC transporter family substrate-binding protein [Streptomyces caniscabiei]MBE4738752.1 ABC transporter family substrate-binding protein [Streptomyces caniscabiei]MBE4758108.1 ABC transporter family substrate-binding protein [Streptomyces caniscabiei]MBE4787769.1 ABC transporter family substrate-binding protein [Streptomyces caniscabiei]MBE4794484.1 ABC transporter family substrate-binding protein [Streptomyces caniscabiei]MDX2945314.1 ABC transporter family substrate-binding protein [Strep
MTPIPHDRVRPRAPRRSLVFLAVGVLTMPVLSGCGEEDPAGRPVAEQDIAPAARNLVADGGTLRWAVDAVPETLNTFQADADPATARIAGAVLPSMYRLDASGRPEINSDYVESAKVVEREPRQVVLYKLNQQAVWSDGREIGAADFAAQWRALSGKDSAYWTARNAGYERIEKIERGDNDLEVRVTFARPYADWKSLFSPLYPKQVMGTPDAFNDGARKNLKVTAGPFALKDIDRKGGEVTLTRNPRWWGRAAKLSTLVLRAVPRTERVEALAEDRVDIAEIDSVQAERITLASRDKKKSGAAGPLSQGDSAKALRSWAIAHGSDEKAADDEISARKKRRAALAAYTDQQSALRGFTVRRSLEPAFTQLALNGSDGPLADERVRRAVARAIDREKLAALVLDPLGLPAVPVGSHLALAGQAAYADNSGALGGQDTDEARALLADAGWEQGGPLAPGRKAAGAEGEQEEPEQKEPEQKEKKEQKRSGSEDSKNGKASDASADSHDESVYILGQDDKPSDADAKEGEASANLAQDGKQFQPGGAPGAYAPRGTRAPADAAKGPLAKNGKLLTLRFVLPSGPGTESLRAVGERIAAMLERVGIRTEISKVADESYFKDHIANGQYDLALYSWPTSAYPATDARPIYAKPVPAADGSLSVEQNYTRVGTDRVDQLFDQAVATLDEARTRSLIRKADARIWAAAGSIPLYQRPQLVAARTGLANAGAFGFQTPYYEDMGFLKKGAKGPARPTGT